MDGLRLLGLPVLLDRYRSFLPISFTNSFFLGIFFGCFLPLLCVLKDIRRCHLLKLVDVFFHPFELKDLIVVDTGLSGVLSIAGLSLLEVLLNSGLLGGQLSQLYLLGLFSVQLEFLIIFQSVVVGLVQTVGLDVLINFVHLMDLLSGLVHQVLSVVDIFSLNCDLLEVSILLQGITDGFIQLLDLGVVVSGTHLQDSHVDLVPQFWDVVEVVFVLYIGLVLELLAQVVSKITTKLGILWRTR